MCDMGKVNSELKAKARVSVVNAKNPLEEMKAKLLERGACGINGIGRQFRIMDDDGNKKLNWDEFKTGMKDFGVRMNDEKLAVVFRMLDRDNSGCISVTEFLQAMQPPMNNRRKQLVEAAFAKMDIVCDEVITVADLAKSYKPDRHPKYLSGEWTKTRVLQEFLKTFEAEGHVDGKVTLDEFMAYYASISCSIDNDAYFDLMMRNSYGELNV